MIDQNKIRQLKERRAIFEANGLHEKAKSIDVEIAKLRTEADKVEVAEHVEQAADDEIPLKVLEPEMDDPERSTETAEADLAGVETATTSHGRGRKAAAKTRARSRKS